MAVGEGIGVSVYRRIGRIGVTAYRRVGLSACRQHYADTPKLRYADTPTRSYLASFGEGSENIRPSEQCYAPRENAFPVHRFLD
jgi:hypothetical protein